MQTAAAYIRVSDKRQDEYSPDSQLKLIKDYAAKNNYVIPDEYIFYDDGISAKNARRRDQFNDMIALAKERPAPFSAILVWKFSRFARNQEESIVFKSMLHRNGVSVISVSEPIPEDAFGSLIERIIEWMDEFYLIRLAPEVRRGMTEKASRGESMSQAAFGYTFNKLTKIYEPDPDAAPAVKNIFESYAAGEGMRSIASRLNAAGYKTIRGHNFDNRGIEYILNNPVYIGKIRWSPNGKKASQRNYTGDFILTDGKHQPLISSDLWDQVQCRLKSDKLKYSRYQRPEQPADYMLKGLVRCSACGATLVRISTKSPSLQCHNYAKGSCRVSHSITIQKANSIVISALTDLVNNSSLPIHPEPRSAPQLPPDYDKQIADINKKLKRLSDAYLNEVYDLNQFKRLKADLDDQLLALDKQKKTALAVNPVDTDAFRAALRSVLAVITDPATTEAARASALRSVLSSITFNKSSSSFDLHFYT